MSVLEAFAPSGRVVRRAFLGRLCELECLLLVALRLVADDAEPIELRVNVGDAALDQVNAVNGTLARSLAEGVHLHPAFRTEAIPGR